MIKLNKKKNTKSGFSQSSNDYAAVLIVIYTHQVAYIHTRYTQWVPEQLTASYVVL